MTDPIRQAYKGYTKKVQTVIVNDKLPGAVILIASILLCGVICLFSSCGMKPARADIIDLDIIAQIESSNNPMAYNSRTQAVGLYQITPICLKEFNQFFYADETGELEHPVIEKELFDQSINKMIAKWYLNKRIPQMLAHYGKEINTRNCIIAYNAGIRAVVRGYCPKETKNYLLRYAKLSEKKGKS